MAQPLTDEEFLNATSPDAVAEPLKPITVGDVASSIAPMTQQAAADALKRYGPATPAVTQNIVGRTAEQQFIAENQREGVPLYTRTDQPVNAFGVPTLEGFVSPMLRYNVERRRTVDDQLKYAQSVLGEENVRVSKDGHDLIVSLPDTTPGAAPEKRKDVLLNEQGLSVGDLASVAAHWPEAAGALVAVSALRSGNLKGLKGFGRYILDVLGGSVGQEVGGAAGDVATRMADRLPSGGTIDFDEIARERAKELPGAILGNALGLGAEKTIGATSRFLQAPFSHARREEQILGLAAIKRLEEATGKKIILSPGEASGFPFLIYGEGYIGSQASGAANVAAARAARDQSVQAVAEALHARGGNVTDEAIGNQLIGRLQSIRDQFETAVGTAGETAETAATAGIKGAIAARSTSANLTPLQAGAKVRQSLESEHANVMATKNQLYSDAYATPGANEAIAPTAGITKTLKDIKSNLPSHEVTTKTVEYNQYGSSMEGTATKTEPIREFIHPEVGQFLSTKLDPNMKLSQLVEMRDLLWDEINRGEAVQGIPTRYLKQVSHSISESIKEGVDSLPTGDFKTKLQAANQYYKNKVLKFEEAGVRPMFKEITEPGYVESSSFVNKTIAQPEQYFRVLNLLGPKSEGASTLRGQFARGVLNKSGNSLFPSRVDAKKLLDNLKELRTNPATEDIYRDVFGSAGDQIVNEAALLGAAQGTISFEDAMKVVAGDRAKLVRIQSMIDAQKKLDVLKSNQLIAKYTAGKLELNTIDPEQFVEGFVNVAKKSDLENLMREISNDPRLEEQIRRKMTEKILFRAGPNLTDTSILKVLGDKNEAEKFRIVLGDRQFELVKDLATALVPRRIAEEAGRGVGSLVKGRSVGNFLRAVFSAVKPSKELFELAEYKIASIVMTSPILRNWIARTPKDLWPDLTKAIVMSTPFIEALREDIRDPTTLGNTVKTIRRFVGPPAQNQPAQPAQPPLTDEEFLRLTQ